MQSTRGTRVHPAWRIATILLGITTVVFLFLWQPLASHTVAAPNSGSQSQNAAAPIKGMNDAGNTTYACPQGTTPIGLPLGQTVGANHVKLYALTNVTDFNNDQDSASLTINMPSGHALAWVIVHAAPGSENTGVYGPEDDSVIPIHIGAGGSGSYTLKTTRYVGDQFLGDMITGVTLCAS
jgi:hypothetical protein